jgi:hypothetical protein
MGASERSAWLPREVGALFPVFGAAATAAGVLAAPTAAG